MSGESQERREGVRDGKRERDREREKAEKEREGERPLRIAKCLMLSFRDFTSVLITPFTFLHAHRPYQSIQSYTLNQHTTLHTHTHAHAHTYSLVNPPTHSHTHTPSHDFTCM